MNLNRLQQGANLSVKLYPSLLQRYVFRELVSVFSLALCALLSLVLIGRGLQLRDMFVGLDLGLLDIAWLFLCLTPMFMLMVMPIACMLSVFLTFLKMSTDREMLALKTGGISLKELLPAPLVFCALAGAATLCIGLYSISWGMSEFRGTILNIASTRAKLVLRPGVFNQDLPGLTIFARKVNPVSGALEQVMVEDRTKEKNSIVILAPHGFLTTDERRGEMLFVMDNGRLYRTVGDQISVLGFDVYTVRLSLADLFRDLSLGEIKPKEMAWDELFELRQNPDTDETARLRVEKEIQKRITFPVACLVLGFFAMPLACFFEGVNRQFGVLLALTAFFIYYAVSTVSLNLVEAGTFPPAVGGWAPNVLFFAGGLVLFRRALLERAPNLGRGLGRAAARIKLLVRRRRAAGRGALPPAPPGRV